MLGKLIRLLALALVFMLFAGCATVQATLQKDHESNVAPYKIPLGALRVMQVVNAEKTDVLSDPVRYERFMRSAIGFISPGWNASDESLLLKQELSAMRGADGGAEDGFLVIGRVYCCEGLQETINLQYVFSPHALPVKPGEFVEVRFGHGKPGEANTVTRVVTGCRWVPNDPRLWVRIPYCSWMPEEGWQEVSSILTASNHAWIKVPTGP